MMMSDTLICRDLYLRYIDTEGRTRVQMHRVWNADRFLEARAAEAQKLNADVEGDGKRLAVVEVITAKQYHDEWKV
jgi:hypothetical protein